jgi:hypothetical protein
MEVSVMRKYRVNIFIPTVYHIDAATKDEAAQKAVKLGKKAQHNTLLEPVVYQVIEFDDAEYVAEMFSH